MGQIRHRLYRPAVQDRYEVAETIGQQAAARSRPYIRVAWPTPMRPAHYRAPFRGVWIKPATASQYSAMIARQTTGSDPLVPEPSGRSR